MSTLSAGYLLAYAIQLVGSAVICAVIYTINSLFFGICGYIRVLLLDVQQTFDRINALYAGGSARTSHEHGAAADSARSPTTKRTSNKSSRTKKFQSSAKVLRSFASITDPVGVARINQATTLLRKFVGDHNDILR